MTAFQNLLRATALSAAVIVGGCTAAYIDTPPSSAQELGAIIDQQFGGDVWAFENSDSLTFPSSVYVREGRADLIAEMLRRGWDPEARPELYDDWAPHTLEALTLNHTDVADVLIAGGYTVQDAIGDCADRYCSSTPLRRGALRDLPELVDVAFRYDAIVIEDGDGRIRTGQSALELATNWAVQTESTRFLTALGQAGYDTRSALAAVQAERSSSGGGGGGGGAVLGLFGSVMGSAVGDVIGGSDGALFEQAFSGVMNNALTADSGAEVMTGTMTALGQSSGLMDSGTASMLGMAGSLFGGGGSNATQSTSTGAIQRPQATQQQVAVPQQSAPLGQPSNYTFSCPMGSGPHTVPVPASNNPQCITAMRTFAYTATCNLVDEMGPAQDAYYSQCAAEIYN